MPTGIWLYSYLTLWMLLLIESFLMIAVVRQVGNLYSYWIQNDPDSGLPLGILAPALFGEEVFDRPVSLAAERGKKTLIYFLSIGCSSCRTVMEEISKQTNLPGVEIVIVISANKIKTSQFLSIYYPTDTPDHLLVLADKDNILSEQYKIKVFPYVVVVNQEGRIGAQGSPVTLYEVQSLILRAEEQRKSQQKTDNVNLVAR